MVLLVILGVFLSAIVWNSLSTAAPETFSTVSDMEDFLKETVERGNPPSIAVSVVDQKGVIYSRAFGVTDETHEQPASDRTVYNWWSITKLFTTVAVLQLQEEAALDLEDEVSEHLPFFRPDYSNAGNGVVRIRHLMNHSAGLPEAGLTTYSWIHREDQPQYLTETDFAKAILPDFSTLQSRPGREAVYTNVGFIVLGALIEAVSGQSYQDYLKEKILDPLDMKETQFKTIRSIQRYRAAGSNPVIDFQTLLLPATGNFSALIRDFEAWQIWFEPLNMEPVAAGGLIGPLTDLSHFMIAYLNLGEFHGSRVLSASSVRTMSRDHHVGADRSRPARSRPGMKHGLGWWIVPVGGSYFLEHTGFGPGFSSILRVYTDHGIGIAVLLNGTGLSRGRFCDAVAKLFDRE